METVEVGHRGTGEVVGIKDRLETNRCEDEGKNVQPRMENLHVDLSVVAEHSVD